MRRIQTVFVAALLAVGLAPAAAPDPVQEPPVATESVSSFGEVIDVRVVNVEVVVTDEQGRRVPGLARGDFRLLVDGREMPIGYFTEVREGQAVAPPAAGPGPPPASPGPAAGGPVGTSYLVFIDDLFSLATHRNEVLRALKGEVARLGPQDRMAIVAFDGRRLQRLSPWSSAAGELASALDAAMARKSHGIQRLAELSSMESSRRLSGISGPGLDFDQLVYARQLTDRLERAVTAAVSTLRAFAAAPGRKVMLLLAGGWPASPQAYAADRLGPLYDPRLPWSGNLFAPLIDMANRLGYTVYPVDVPGLQAAGPDASSAAPSATRLNVRELEVHSTLDLIAARTGGLPLINAARHRALSSAQADTGSYYWLGFSPNWRHNDQRHSVKVEVLRPGLKIRSRSGVLDLSRRSEITMLVEHALLFGGAGMAKMPMQLGKPVRSGRKEMDVPITLTIPLSSITVLPVDGQYVADLELRFAALDERGDRSDIPVIPLHFTFDRPPPARGGHVVYETGLKLRRIEQHVIAALFDPLSSKITTAEADVAP
jgi:VWFA-related protein